MELADITNDFLALFQTINLEVTYTDNYLEKPKWTGNEYVYDNILYRTCPIKVNGFSSIAKFEYFLKKIENDFLLKFSDWKKDKNDRQIIDGIKDIVYHVDRVFTHFKRIKSDDTFVFTNGDQQYGIADIYEHDKLVISKIGDEVHPQGLDYTVDYEPKLSYFIKLMYDSLNSVKTYFSDYSDYKIKTADLKSNDSFTLKKGYKLNITNTKLLMIYLEGKGMITEGNTYDLYQLFQNQTLKNKIKWIGGPGHLKSFLSILKKEGIIEKTSIFEIAEKCFEFTGSKYNRAIRARHISHGHLPNTEILNNERIKELFK